MHLDETAHHTVTRSGCNSISWSICGFESLHILQFCLLTLPFKSKWASSDIKMQFRMFSSCSTISIIFWQNSKRIGKSAEFSLLVSCNLYGNKSKSLCKIVWFECLLIFIWADKLLVETRGLACMAAATAPIFLRSNWGIPMIRRSFDCPTFGKAIHEPHYCPSARRCVTECAPIFPLDAYYGL